MSVGKGVNNFKKSQDIKTRKNKQNIDNCLLKIGHLESLISFSKFIFWVASVVELHPTTIYKNKTYYNNCSDAYLKNLKKHNVNHMTEEEKIISDLKIDNLKLLSQINSLNIHIKELKDKIDILNYKCCFYKLLKYFENKIKINNIGEVFDISTTSKKKIICSLHDND